ncbi:MAG TPA: ABC transporter ATP-binding protein [Caproicibacter sp.]|nr:ABC transporter ATP-binding protein [Caproicibacter sp.]
MKLEVKNVTKRFPGGKTALNNVSLTFEGPHIYGLLGRNGAGKTTLMNLIAGRLFPTQGKILLDGEPVLENDRALGKIYSMSETNYFPENMKVCEVFHRLNELYPHFNMDYAVELGKKFDLDTLAKNNKLSTGYSSIVKLIAAMACGAPVILLDEPVLGLDANNRDLFYRELIENYGNEPRLIIFSTHLIEEAAKLIDRAVIIKAGSIIQDEDVDTLTSGAYSVSGPAGAVDAFAAGKTVLGFDAIGGLKTVYLRGTPDSSGLPAGLELGRMSLQKLFIELTNR